jgi:amino acid transporter
MDKLILLIGYLTTTRPDTNFEYTSLTLGVAGVLVAMAIVIRLWRKKFAKDEILRRVIKPYPTSLVVFAIALLLLLFFRVLGFPIFSMRLWWVALAVLFVIWAVKAAFGLSKEYQERKQRFGHHEAKSRYLPRKKKR